MDQRISLITLGYDDYDRARAFYAAMGWTDAVAPDDEVVFFQAGGMVLALWDRAKLAADSAVQDNGGWGGITIAYNVGSPEEVDAVLADAKAAGGSVRAPGHARRRGAATRGSSSTPRATRGRLLTTPGGPCGTTGRSASAADRPGLAGAEGGQAAKPLRPPPEAGPALLLLLAVGGRGRARSC